MGPQITPILPHKQAYWRFVLLSIVGIICIICNIVGQGAAKLLIKDKIMQNVQICNHFYEKI